MSIGIFIPEQMLSHTFVVYQHVYCVPYGRTITGASTRTIEARK